MQVRARELPIELSLQPRRDRLVARQPKLDLHHGPTRHERVGARQNQNDRGENAEQSRHWRRQAPTSTFEICRHAVMFHDTYGRAYL